MKCMRRASILRGSMEADFSDMNQETLGARSSFEKVVPLKTRRGDGRNDDQRRRTNNGMTKRVFISYSRDDQPMVQQLSGDLRAVGHSVFIDTELSGGQAWWSQLLGEIRDCDVYMPILSSKWLASRPCGLESDYAAKLSRPFLPVQLGDVSPRLFRPEIAETQWVAYQPSDKSADFRTEEVIDGVGEDKITIFESPDNFRLKSTFRRIGDDCTEALQAIGDGKVVLNVFIGIDVGNRAVISRF